MDYPRLSTVAWLAIFTALCFVTARWVGDRSSAGWDLFRLLMVLVGISFAVLTLFEAANLVAHYGAARYYEIQRASATTERVKLLEAWSRLTPEQAAAFGATSINLAWVISGLDGEVIPFVLRVPGGEISVSFLETFIVDSDEEYLIPIRRYGEGTREREYATLLTNTFVGNGWAEPARGNLPARWINKPAAERLLDRMAA